MLCVSQCPTGPMNDVKRYVWYKKHWRSTHNPYVVAFPLFSFSFTLPLSHSVWQPSIIPILSFVENNQVLPLAVSVTSAMVDVLFATGKVREIHALETLGIDTWVI